MQSGLFCCAEYGARRRFLRCRAPLRDKNGPMRKSRRTISCKSWSALVNGRILCYNETMELIDCKPYAGMRVCVALSGGRDSVALLHALKAGGVGVSALTCGHGMRAASEADIAFVEGLCRDWDVPLRVFRADIPARAKAQKRGLEETARLWRYECFARVVAEGEADTVATAHHKDDLAETLLFRLARGTSAAGLNVFPARAGAPSRPLKPGIRIAKEGKVPDPSLLVRSVALLDLEDHAPVVLAAGLAGAVGQMVSAAVGALHDVGRVELPDGRAPLVTPLAGHFTLGNCHVLHLLWSAV